MQTKLLQIADLFVTLDCDVYHYQAPDKTKAPYCVWSEDDRIDLTAGNKHAEKAWQGSIHIFTHDEFDSLFEDVEEVLENNDFSWYFNFSEYNEEADLIHYEWIWTYA